MPTAVVSQRLGHSTPSTTANIYQHARVDMQNDGAAKLSKLLARAAK